MRIPRIHLDRDLKSGLRIDLEAQAAHYLGRVLRLSPGAEVIVFNGRAGEHSARLLSLDRRTATLALGPERGVQRESKLQIALAQGISRGERMDHTLQKAVELGIRAVYPLTTQRCGVMLEGARMERRLSHWRGVIVAACAQCGRNTLPTLHRPRTLEAFLDLDRAALDLLLDHDGSHSLRCLTAPSRGTVRLLVGPEGGLTRAEATLARQRGFLGLRLGPRILRTETAPLAALAGLQALWGDLG